MSNHSTARLEVAPAHTRADLKAFMKLPWRIYRNDPHWVPPLLGELANVLDREKHPYHKHAQSAYFIARRNGAVVGRIVASINHLYNEFQGTRAGSFGFFESIDDVEVARALLDTAERWIAERGMTSVMGPMNFSTNDEFVSPGVLIDGFDAPPMFLMAHNPPYYQQLLEECGYTKARDLLSYWVNARDIPERYIRTAPRVKRAAGVTLRPLNMKDLAGEIARIKDIYNSAWERNWGFVPMTDAELDHMAHSIKPILNPKLCVMAEINNEAVGFAVQFLNMNKAFAHMNGRMLPFGWAKFLWYKRNIHQVRVLTLGVKPEHRQKGLDALMILEMMIEANKLDAARGECSWILEDNEMMRRGLERIGGYVYKTYRVYEKPVGAGA